MNGPPDAYQVWSQCCSLLREEIAQSVWMSTFQGVVPRSIDQQCLFLDVPTSVVKERIEGRYRSLVVDALSATLGRPAKLELDVLTQVPTTADGDSTATETVDPLDDLVGADLGHTMARSDEPAEPAAGGHDDAADVSTLAVDPEPRYTFDAFVTGASNRFAYAATQAVAETPGRSYNPLFIYGDAGLGKTHLLQAIAHYVGEHYPDKIVRYISAESFLNDFVESIRMRLTNDFKRRWREVDVLLVDDIQFIEKAERFQEEFFHTFNQLHDRNSQIVLTSDRAPDALDRLEKRLRSRFMMGLITDIQPPDIETRTAIVRKKAEAVPSPVDDSVLDFIAEHITDNIRELEGALTRVTAYANLYGQPVDVGLAEGVLSDILGERQERPITPRAIIAKTAEMYGFTIEEIQGKNRRRPLVTARQVAMYAIRELTELSYPAIGREFSDRDHTTVIHAVDKITALMQERKAVFHQVQALIQDIKRQ